MGAPIEFNIKILGGAGAELAGIAGGFGETDKGARKSAEGVKIFDSEIGTLKSSIGGLEINLGEVGKKGGAVFTFDLAEAAHAAVEVVTELVAKVFELGKEIVKVAGETQDLNLAINLKVGEEGAKGIDELAEKFGKTRHDNSDIKRAILPLLDIGIADQGLLGDLTTVAADLETRSAGQQKLAGSLEAFATLAKRGQIKPGMLSSLGVVAGDYFALLAGHLGKDVESVKKLAKKGGVDKDLALRTLVEIVQQKEGGAIGGAALAGGATLGGTLAHLANVPHNLIEGIAEGPGMKKIQVFLDHLVDVLSGDAGKAVITSLVDGMTRLIDILPAAEAWPEIIETTIDTLKVLGSILGFVGDVVGELGDFIGSFFAGFYLAGVKLVDEFTGIGTFIGEWAGKIYLKAIDIGAQLVHGIVDGITHGITYVEDSVTHLGGAIVGKLKGLLGISSPSRVFMELGAYSAEGFGQGIERGTERVGDAGRAMVQNVVGASAPAAPAAASGATSIGRIEINVSGATSPAETAESVRVELEKLFYRLRLGMGVPA